MAPNRKIVSSSTSPLHAFCLRRYPLRPRREGQVADLVRGGWLLCLATGGRTSCSLLRVVPCRSLQEASIDVPQDEKPSHSSHAVAVVRGHAEQSLSMRDPFLPSLSRCLLILMALGRMMRRERESLWPNGRLLGVHFACVDSKGNCARAGWNPPSFDYLATTTVRRRSSRRGRFRR